MDIVILEKDMKLETAFDPYSKICDMINRVLFQERNRTLLALLFIKVILKESIEILI